MSLIPSNQFVHITNDLAKSLVSKVQRTRKIKWKLSEQEIISNRIQLKYILWNWKYTQTLVNSGINDLPIRPIVSNLNTAQHIIWRSIFLSYYHLYRTQKVLWKTIEFIEDLKQKLSRKHKLVSFDVKSLFKNVSLHHTVDIILRRINEKNEITTSIAKHEIKYCVWKMSISPLNPKHKYKQMMWPWV